MSVGEENQEELPQRSASDILMEALNDDDTLLSYEIAKQEGNNLADTTALKDLDTMSYQGLINKYGLDVAGESYKMRGGERLYDNLNDGERGYYRTSADLALGALATGASMAGSLGSVAFGSVGLTGLGEDAARGGRISKSYLQSKQSQRLKDRKDLDQVRSLLDRQDRNEAYDKDLEAGTPEWLAITKREVFGVGDAIARIVTDPVMAGNLTAEAAGSLPFSMLTAQGGIAAASAMGARFGLGAAGLARLKTAAIATSVGTIEASSVYGETLLAVLDMPMEQLRERPEFQELMSSGELDEDTAKSVMALHTARMAGAIQLPVAATVGLLSTKIEAQPLGVFRGSGMLENMKTIGKETLEEGFQEGSGTLAQGLAIQGTVNEDMTASDILQGVGEAAGTGAIAGTMLTSSLAAPSVIGSATGPTTEAIKAAGEVAGSAARTAGEVTGAQLERSATKAQKKANRKSTETKLQGLSGVTQLAAANPENAPDSVQVITAPTEASPVSEAFAKSGLTETSSLVETTQAIISSIDGGKVDIESMTDDDVMFAMDAFIETEMGLEDSGNQAIRDRGIEFKETQAYLDVVEKFNSIDLNESLGPDTEITPENVSKTITVAANQPGNINPGFAKRILEQNDENISPEQVNILQAAVEISEAINERAESNISVSDETGVSLKDLSNYTKPAKGKGGTVAETSRSIALDGFVDEKGRSQRSLADFTSEILKAGQNPDRSFEVETSSGFISNGKDVAASFQKFAQHMQNKVAALEESVKTGKPAQYSSLVNGEAFIEPGTENSADPIQVHQNNAKSVRFGLAVHADAVAVAKSYNALAKAFPDMFETKSIPVPKAPSFGFKPEAENQAENQAESTTQADTVPETSTDTQIDLKPLSEASDALLDKAANGKLDASNLNDADLTELEALGIQPNEKGSYPVAKLRKESKRRNRPGKADKAQVKPSSKPAPKAPEKAPEKAPKKAAEILETKPISVASNELLVKAVQGRLEAGKLSDADLTELEALGIEPNSKGQFPVVKLRQEALRRKTAAMKEINDRARKETKERTEASEKVIEKVAQKLDPKPIPESEPEVQTEAQTETQPEAVVEEAVEEKTIFAKLSEFARSTLKPRKDPARFDDYDAMMRELEQTEGSTDFLELVRKLRDPISEVLQESLDTVKYTKDGKTMLEELRADPKRVFMPRFAGMAFVDPETGQFDQNVVDMTITAMAEWMTTAKNTQTKSYEKILSENLKISPEDVKTADEVYAILNGINKNQIFREVVPMVLDLLNIDKNSKSALVHYNGMVEGMIEEVLHGLTEVDSTFRQVQIPIFSGGKLVTTGVYLIDGITDYQQTMDPASKGMLRKIFGVKDRQTPSIGEKIADIDDRQSKTGRKLTRSQQKAVKNIQDVGFVIANGMLEGIRAMPRQEVLNALGFESSEHLPENHPLALSIEGKNQGLSRDYDEAMQVIKLIEDQAKETGKDVSEIPAYFHIKVGGNNRHMMQGINPQNNKILRLLVTPTHTEIDMTDRMSVDRFWLGIAQASGIAKIEKKFHDNVLNEIQGKFQEEFGDAVDAMVAQIEGGTLDTSKMPDSFDTQQFGAIRAVAEFRVAQNRGETTLPVALSMEKDGMTNGSANTIMALGQGKISKQEAKTMASIGMHWGRTEMSANEFYENQNNADVYQTTSNRVSEDLFNNEQTTAREQALGRIMSVMADFEINTDGSEVTLSRSSSKGPTTKIVYRSGVRGVGKGIADEVITNLYRAITGGSNLQYDGQAEGDIPFSLKSDLETALGITFQKGQKRGDFRLTPDQTKDFREFVSKSLGEALVTASRGVLGSKIDDVSEALTFYSQVHSAFAQALFEREIKKLIDAKKGSGFAGKSTITQADYNAVLKKIQEVGQDFSTVDGNLEVGAVDSLTAPQGGTQFFLSTDMRNSARTETRMKRPGNVGVKIIANLIIGGRGGDASMINGFMSKDSAPEKAIMIFDGVDFDVNSFHDFDSLINESVYETWTADTIGPIRESVEKLAQTEHQDLLTEAFNSVIGSKFYDGNKALEYLGINTMDDLVATMETFHLKNLARSNVMKKVPLSVHQMAGGQQGYNRTGPNGETYMSLDQINVLIDQEFARLVQSRVHPHRDFDDLVAPVSSGDAGVIEDVEFTEDLDNESLFEEILPEKLANGTDQNMASQRKAAKEKKSKVLATNAKTLAAELAKSSKDKTVLRALKAIQNAIPDMPVVTGTLEEVNEHRKQNFGDDGIVLSARGQIDTVNNIIYLVSPSPETMAHELIHAATYATLEAHYAGESNPAVSEAVTRLESLMDQFMELDAGKSQNVVKAKNAILKHRRSQTDNTKAAALNEFMAWSLSNRHLAKKLQSTKSNVFATMAKAAVDLMSRIMGVSPSSDMYSNVLFNTQVIAENSIDRADPNSDGRQMRSPLLEHSADLTPTAREFNQRWIGMLQEKFSGREKTLGKTQAKQKRLLRYTQNAKDVFEKLQLAGFSFTPQDKGVFSSIHALMAINMQLDPRGAEALNKVYQHVLSNLTPDMFINPDQYTDLMELLGKSQNDQGVADSIALLLALSQTNAEFRYALDQIPDQERVVPDERTFDNTLENAFAYMSKKLLGTIDVTGKDQNELLDQIAEVIIEKNKSDTIAGLTQLGQITDFTEGLVVGGFQLAARTARQQNAKLDGLRDRSKAGKVIAAPAELATRTLQFLDKDTVKGEADGILDLTHKGEAIPSLVSFREAVAELRGVTDINSKMTMLVNRLDHAVQNTRQRFREEIPIILYQDFKKPPSTKESKSIHRGMGRSDMQNLLNAKSDNIAQVMEIMGDKTKLDDAIEDVETKLAASMSGKEFQRVLDQSDNLAQYMMTRKVSLDLNRNALAINKGKENGDVVLIDRLVSLYAMEKMTKTDRDAVARVYKRDPEAMTKLLVYLKSLNVAEEQKAASKIARMNGLKGYIPDESEKSVSIEIRPDKEEASLIAKGYVRVGNYKAHDGYSKTKMGIYKSTTKIQGNYSQGAIQQVHNSYRGVDATTGLSVGNLNTAGVITGNDAKIIKALQSKGKLTEQGDMVIPVKDEKGEDKYYERAIRPDIQSKHMDRRSNVFLSIGAWEGRQVEEKLAEAYNQEVVDEVFDKAQISDADQLTNIADPDLKDPIYRDSWAIIPEGTKRYIESKFGKDKFMVRNDMINLTTGYRDPSMLDMFTGKTRTPAAIQNVVRIAAVSTFGNRAIPLVGQAEGLIQEAVSGVKDVILVRSLIVPTINVLFNVFHLLSIGVAPRVVARAYKDKWKELNIATRNQKEVIRLETQITMNKGNGPKVALLQKKLKNIEDENSRLSIGPLIQEGLYKNISEGLTALDLDPETGTIQSWFNAQMEKLPDPAQGFINQAMVNRGTAVHDASTKLMLYGDFLGKSILYDHFQSEGIKHEEAILKADEEFVNFTPLPGRVRTGLEALGLTWFMAYKIRILKIAMKTLREHPVRALLTANAIDGGVLSDNIVAVASESARLDAALGIGTIFNATELNPYMQAYDMITN